MFWQNWWRRELFTRNPYGQLLLHKKSLEFLIHHQHRFINYQLSSFCHQRCLILETTFKSSRNFGTLTGHFLVELSLNQTNILQRPFQRNQVKSDTLLWLSETNYHPLFDKILQNMKRKLYFYLKTKFSMSNTVFQLSGKKYISKNS